MSAQELVNVGGRILPAAEATVSAMDHGFLFGDSVYETFRTYGGNPFRFEAHARRLASSAAALALALPLDAAALLARVRATLAAAALEEAAVRVIVTRGVGPISLDPAAAGPPTVLVYVRPRPRHGPRAYAAGVGVVIVSRPRNARASLDPNVKSGNYLNNVLAYVEARAAGAFEGIMLNAAGEVTEACTSNVFAVKDGRVITAPVDSGLLSGITRAVVLECCAEDGIPFAEEPFGPEALRAADEAFLTSTLKQVLPVTTVDGRPVGTGRPGAVAARLLAAYRRKVAAETGVRPEEDP